MYVSLFLYLGIQFLLIHRRLFRHMFYFEFVSVENIHFKIQ